ncbi:MAG: DUF4398 domain-containing protein, partial [Gallionella sp.]
MKKNQYSAMILTIAAILSGCGSMPRNSALSDAHNSYNNAQADPQITSLAGVELKEASDSLNKADTALRKGESTATVNQLAYVAQQQVAIAEQTAKRKTAEAAVTDAASSRDRMRLEARTEEADTAKQQAMTARQIADQQAAQLATANAEAQRNQSRLEQTTAEAEAAKQQAADARAAADQKSAELAEANTQREQDKALIAQQESQLKELNDKQLNAKKTERGIVITLGDVLFGV